MRNHQWFVIEALIATAIGLLPRGVEAGDHAVALQGGFWTVEAEYRAPFGLFADLGICWGPWAPDGELDVPIQGKLGYQIGLGQIMRLRLGVRAAWAGTGHHLFSESECEAGHGGCDQDTVDLIAFEVGLRIEDPSGVVFGFDLPLVTSYQFHHWFEDQPAKEALTIPFFLFNTQLYAGYAFRF